MGRRACCWLLRRGTSRCRGSNRLQLDVGRRSREPVHGQQALRRLRRKLRQLVVTRSVVGCGCARLLLVLLWRGSSARGARRRLLMLLLLCQ